MVLGALVPCILWCVWCCRIVFGGQGTRAGSLTPSGMRNSLGGPMLCAIALVMQGRCHPMPYLVSESACADCHARGVVTGCLTVVVAGQGLTPVLVAPLRRVSRIDSDDANSGFGGHGEQPSAKFPGGDAADELPKLLLSSVFLTGFGVGEDATSSTAMARTPSRWAHRSSCDRACRNCASRWQVVPEVSYPKVFGRPNGLPCWSSF